MSRNGGQVPTQANKHFLLQGHLRVIKNISQRWWDTFLFLNNENKTGICTGHRGKACTARYPLKCIQLQLSLGFRLRVLFLKQKLKKKSVDKNLVQRSHIFMFFFPWGTKVPNPLFTQKLLWLCGHRAQWWPAGGGTEAQLQSPPWQWLRSSFPPEGWRNRKNQQSHALCREPAQIGKLPPTERENSNSTGWHSRTRVSNMPL